MSEQDTNVTLASRIFRRTLGNAKVLNCVLIMGWLLYALLGLSIAVQSVLFYGGNHYKAYINAGAREVLQMEEDDLRRAGWYVGDSLLIGTGLDSAGTVDGLPRDAMFTAADDAFLEKGHRALHWANMRDMVDFRVVIIAACVLMVIVGLFFARLKDADELPPEKLWKGKYEIVRIWVGFLLVFIPLTILMLWVQLSPSVHETLFTGLDPAVDLLPRLYSPPVLKALGWNLFGKMSMLLLGLPVIFTLGRLPAMWKQYKNKGVQNENANL